VYHHSSRMVFRKPKRHSSYGKGGGQQAQGGLGMAALPAGWPRRTPIESAKERTHLPRPEPFKSYRPRPSRSEGKLEANRRRGRELSPTPGAGLSLTGTRGDNRAAG
jgi:hypothetical protein